MNINKVIEKGAEGLATVVIAFVVANIPAISEFAIKLIPEEIATLTVAGLVAFIIKAFGNWLKHIKD